MSQSHHESSVVGTSNDKIAQINSQQDDEPSIHNASTNDARPRLTPIPSHIHTQDAPIQHYTSHIEIPDEIYDRLSHSRKIIIVALLSFCSFLAPISSTTILSAIPEVAATYNSTGTIINLSNALYMLAMGLSPMFFSPLIQVYGRRWVCCSLYPDFPTNTSSYVS